MKKIVFLLLSVIGVSLIWLGLNSTGKATGGTSYVVSGSAMVSLPQLLERSRSEQKPLVLLFTGSSWCLPCKAFAKSVFTLPEWVKFVREEIIFVVYDFPPDIAGMGEAAEIRNQMAFHFQIEGFPTLIKVDQNGHESGRIVSYPGGGPHKYITWARQ